MKRPQKKKKESVFFYHGGTRVVVLVNQSPGFRPWWQVTLLLGHLINPTPVLFHIQGEFGQFLAFHQSFPQYFFLSFGPNLPQQASCLLTSGTFVKTLVGLWLSTTEIRIPVLSSGIQYLVSFKTQQLQSAKDALKPLSSTTQKAYGFEQVTQQPLLQWKLDTLTLQSC